MKPTSKNGKKARPVATESFLADATVTPDIAIPVAIRDF
jgi:hypothetical protein